MVSQPGFAFCRENFRLNLLHLSGNAGGHKSQVKPVHPESVPGDKRIVISLHQKG